MFGEPLFLFLLASSLCVVPMMVVLASIGWKTERIRIGLWSVLALVSVILDVYHIPYAVVIGSVVTGALSLRWFILEVRQR
jgi:hypothetical protein